MKLRSHWLTTTHFPFYTNKQRNYFQPGNHPQYGNWTAFKRKPIQIVFWPCFVRQCKLTWGYNFHLSRVEVCCTFHPCNFSRDTTFSFWSTARQFAVQQFQISRLLLLLTVKWKLIRINCLVLSVISRDILITPAAFMHGFL